MPGVGRCVQLSDNSEHPGGGIAPQAAESAAAALHELHALGYLPALDAQTSKRLESAWAGVVAAAGGDAPPETIDVLFQRQLDVPRTALGCARLEFDELCGRPRGAADYLALAQRFHTLVLDGVPAMSMQARALKRMQPATSTRDWCIGLALGHNDDATSWACLIALHVPRARVQLRDKARRFITLVDELYNAGACLVCRAAVPPDALFAGTPDDEAIIDLEALQFEGAVPDSKLRRNLVAAGGVAPVAGSAQEQLRLTAHLGGAEEQFAFRRALSRLHEMQTPRYRRRRMHEALS